MKSLLLLLVFAVPASAQEFTYRGFGQIQSTFYPQTTPQDDERVAVEALFRIEPAYKPVDWLTLSGIVRRAHRHDQSRSSGLARRRARRGLQRPPLSLRHARATLRKGTLDASISASSSFAGARPTS